jgi:hypothetical protein
MIFFFTIQAASKTLPGNRFFKFRPPFPAFMYQNPSQTWEISIPQDPFNLNELPGMPGNFFLPGIPGK